MTLLHDRIYAGQYEDEKIINKYLLKNPDRELGTYVDIGAGDAFEISNTYYYYWRGWKGLLVEPHPRYTKSIQNLRMKDIFEPIAISDYNGEIEMCDTATVGSIIGDDYKKQWPEKCFKVKCMTLNDLFDKYPQFRNTDILSIDIETHEDKVLSCCDFNIIKPQIIIIEYNMRGIDYSKKWEKYILPYYIPVEKTEGNAIYVRKHILSKEEIKILKTTTCSQHKEEEILNKYIGKDPNKETGTYIDIGAYYPIEINNTYYYYLRGWRGLLIEPQPCCHMALLTERPNDIVESIALSNYDGELAMCDSATEDTSIGQEYKQRFPERRYTVPCMTLDNLIKKYPEFSAPDFVTIDIKTNEDKLLEKTNFAIFKPKVILIEYKVRDVDYRPRWEHYILPYYDFKEFIASNALYVRKEDM